jgi:hypothetical protein
LEIIRAITVVSYCWGYFKGSASGDIAVCGLAAADENFIGGSDQVAYEINVASAKGRLNITVELLYQDPVLPFCR